MKKIHIAIATNNIEKSVEDYTKRFECEPSVVVDNEYALFKTDTVNFSIRKDDSCRPGELRHLGFEDATVKQFTTEKDVNGIVWESFSSDLQDKEINDTINSNLTVGECSVKMIPLQKWVNIGVSVYNQVVDIYIDGQLASSCVLKRFPKINTNDIEITPDGGFSGIISRVKFMNSALTIQQAKNIYYQGPIVSNSIFNIIPDWVYWSILLIIIISIIFSFI